MGDGFGLDIALRLPLQGIIPNGGGSAAPLLIIACFQNAPRLMRALGPKPGQAISLQFHAHLQFIGPAMIQPALRSFDFFKHAQFMRDVTPDLMRDDIGCGEIPSRAKLAQQVPMKFKSI